MVGREDNVACSCRSRSFRLFRSSCGLTITISFRGTTTDRLREITTAKPTATVTSPDRPLLGICNLSGELHSPSSQIVVECLSKVEDAFFKVPTHHFVTHSEVFADMLSLPQGQAAEGQSRENPITLPVSKRDFRTLLCILYPLYVVRFDTLVPIS